MKQILGLFLLFMLILFNSANAQERIPAKGFAVYSGDSQFKPCVFTRQAVEDKDIQIEILYSGISHSDLHHVYQDWGKEEFPMVPGQEIVGRVIKIGNKVTKFQVGDYAGVGGLINSCGKCEFCLNHKEQYCKDVVYTYNSHDSFHNNELTWGGYSNTIVLTENFAIKIPANARIDKVAPLLCTGITTYSPIHYAGVKKGDKVGIAGFGELGHMALQYMVALGAEVTVFDINREKSGDARRLGAVHFVNVNNPDSIKGLDNTLSFIINTIPAKYDPSMYLKMLHFDGQLCIVGLPATANLPGIRIDKFIREGGRKVFGSQIGGIKETQEMIDYSLANNIYPEVDIIKADGNTITEAYQKVLDDEVKYSIVIDMSTLK